ncbi:MAG: ACT domain-containing protein [Pseudomonadota bacterium]
MTVQIVLTVIARDRPGVVERVSEVIERHRGNWVDSSMARLGGEFAGILMIELPEASVAPLEVDLASLAKTGIDCMLRRDLTAPVVSGRRARLDITGVDHPGIIHEVASALARQGVSIDSLETRVFTGSMSGERMFAATVEIVMPAGGSSELLREALEEIARDMMVDIDLEEQEPETMLA